MIITDKHPLLHISIEFSELCKPLVALGIHHITYQKQFNDGGRITLSNKPQWVADYYNLQLYDTSLFEESSKIYRAEHKIWLGGYDLAVYQHGKNYYNSVNSITVTEPQEDGCEFYFFGSSAENQADVNFIASNMDIIYHFILYLKDRGISLFDKANKHKINLSRRDNKIDEGKVYLFQQEEKMKFYQNTRIYKYIFDSGEFKGIKLTSREIDCIHFLLQNKTATETAFLMNISRRTVESYLDNIRIKLNCESKLELIKKLSSYKMLGAIR